MELAHKAQRYDNFFADCGEGPGLNRNNIDQLMSSGFSDLSLNSGEVMDPAIWGGIPDSLLYAVFLKLPFKSLNRICGLNKQWMSTDFFSDVDAAAWFTKPGRFILLKGGPKLPIDKHEAWVFDTPAEEWCKFRLGPFPSSNFDKFKGPFASAGGLLCYMSESGSGGKLEVMVCNPVIRAWRLLPLSLNLFKFPILTHMFMAVEEHYSITLVALCGVALVIEVYDSESNTWRFAEKSPSHLTSYYNFFKGSNYLGLATIDPTSNSIKRLLYPAALRKSAFVNQYEDKCEILESRGRLFMCSDAPRMEGIWQRLATQWTRVCTFPRVLQIYEKVSLYICEDVVLLVGFEPHCFPPKFVDEDPNKIVMFNKATRKWSILPQISSSFSDMEELVQGLMFEPRFDVKP